MKTQNLFATAFAAALLTATTYAGELSPSPTPGTSPTATPAPSATPIDDHGGGGSGGGGSGGSGGGGGGSSQGKLSLHGFYQGTTSTGSIVLLYVEKDTRLQVNVLDLSGQSVGYAEGVMSNGAFSFALSNGQTITGTAGERLISGNVGGATFQAGRASDFGGDESVAGRFVGVASGPGGDSRVMFVIDRSQHIAMIQVSGTAPNFTRTGGFGTVTAPVAPSTSYTFTLDKTVGSTSAITGSFSIVDGAFQGSFTTSAGTYTVNSFKSTLVNRMANISTRGLVGQGQAQLIGGFIITGGPKMVMIRALGPSLAAAGVSPALANPALKLYANGTLLAQNDDWKANANASEIVASKLAPSNDLDAALLVRLEPGAYTTIVSASGADTTQGIGLVEIYEVNHD